MVYWNNDEKNIVLSNDNIDDSSDKLYETKKSSNNYNTLYIFVS